ncbi:MAG: NADP-dependent oxidoreductase [Caldimonas sp.]
MKAARLESFGQASNLSVKEVSKPHPRPADLLVRVVASGVNPIEWKIRSGAMGGALRRPLPVTLGWECAGVVEQVGAEVTSFTVGDEVYGYTEFSRDGTHAEYVSVDASQMARKPASLSFPQAAAVPMTGQAAWSLLEAAGPVAGRRALIHGAGGSVGHWLVQLAGQAGASVVATVSGADIDSVLALGANEAIDYQKQRFEDVGSVDIVFDLVGGDTQTRSWALLPKGGLLLSIANPPDEALAKTAGATGKFIFTQPRGTVLAQIAAAIDAGRLRPLAVDSVRPLADVAAVHAAAEAGTLRGKTVLSVALS